MTSFSRYSQRNRKRRIALNGQMRELEGKVRIAETKLATRRKDRERQIGLIVGGQNLYSRNLEDSNRDIAEIEGMLKALGEAKARVAAGLAALEPTAKQAVARARTQGKILALLQKRVDGDGEIERQVNQLRESLKAREALSAELLAMLGEIDFEVPRDLDAERFEALLCGLPGSGVHAYSGHWRDWFLGRASTQKFTVTSEPLVVPETLHSSGVFEPGEACLITREQLTEAQREKPHPMTTLDFQHACGSGQKPPQGLPPVGSNELARWLR